MNSRLNADQSQGEGEVRIVIFNKLPRYFLCTCVGEVLSGELNYIDFLTGINSERYVQIQMKDNVGKYSSCESCAMKLSWISLSIFFLPFLKWWTILVFLCSFSLVSFFTALLLNKEYPEQLSCLQISTPFQQNSVETHSFSMKSYFQVNHKG